MEDSVSRRPTKDKTGIYVAGIAHPRSTREGGLSGRRPKQSTMADDATVPPADGRGVFCAVTRDTFHFVNISGSTKVNKEGLREIQSFNRRQTFLRSQVPGGGAGEPGVGYPAEGSHATNPPMPYVLISKDIVPSQRRKRARAQSIPPSMPPAPVEPVDQSGNGQRRLSRGTWHLRGGGRRDGIHVLTRQSCSDEAVLRAICWNGPRDANHLVSEAMVRFSLARRCLLSLDHVYLHVRVFREDQLGRSVASPWCGSSPRQGSYLHETLEQL